MAFDVMGFLAANGMLPGMQRSAQQSPQQSAPIFNALLEQSVPPQPVPLGIAPSPAPQPAPIGAAPFPAPEPMPLGVATPEMYGPPGGYEPMLRPTAFERELYGAPPAEIMSNQAFGMVPPIEPPTGPVVRPSMSAVNLPPLPPPGFASRRPAPTMGFAQPAAVSGMAPMQPAQTEYPSMFDLFLAAQPDEDLAYNAQFAEEPAAPAEAPVAKQEKDKELESWQPGSVFTLPDPADKEGKKKISVDTFTPTSQQGKGSARITTSRGTIYVDESSKLWPQIEARHQQLLGGYQQRAAKDLTTPPSNQYGYAVVLADGTKAPAMFDANGDMIVEDPTYGSVRMDPTDVDPKNIIFPINPGTGKPDPTEYQNAIKAIGKEVVDPFQSGLQTAMNAAPSNKYRDPDTLTKNAKYSITYDQYGLPTYTVIDDPDYPPGFAQQLQKRFDLDRAAMLDEIQSKIRYNAETGESIKDARIRQLREEIKELEKVTSGGSSAALTPTIDPTEAVKSIGKKQQEIEDILNGSETLRLGDTVILQVGPTQTFTTSFNPNSWAAVSAYRRGLQTAAGDPNLGAVVSPEQHGRTLVGETVGPYINQLGGMATMTMTEESKGAINATAGRINKIVSQAIGQFGQSGKLGTQARQVFANDPVTFTYQYGGQEVTESMPLQQASIEFRDAVAEAKTAMATRSELDMAAALQKLYLATRRFSGSIDVPYIDGGTTFDATEKERNLINSLFQQPLTADTMVTTPMTLSPDTRTVVQQQPIQGQIPRPTGGTTAKGVPGPIMPVFNLPGVPTDAGKGVGRLGTGTGSSILATISNADPKDNASISFLKTASPGVAAASAKANLINAMHGDGNPDAASKQAGDISNAIKEANKIILTDENVRKHYAMSVYNMLADLGYRAPGTSDAGFAADWEKLVQGRMNERDFVNKYINGAQEEFAKSKLGGQMVELSKHQPEMKRFDQPASVGNLKFTEDCKAKINQFARAGVLVGKGSVSGVSNDGIVRLPSGHKVYFFPDPYDPNAQSFLGVPDIADGSVMKYTELTPEQREAYENDPNKLPSILKAPADLPGLHVFTGLSGGKLATSAGALIDALTPKMQSNVPSIGANTRINHAASKGKRWSNNTMRIQEDENKSLEQSSIDAAYRGFTDVIVIHSILPNDRTVKKENNGSVVIWKVPYR